MLLKIELLGWREEREKYEKNDNGGNVSDLRRDKIKIIDTPSLASI